MIIAAIWSMLAVGANAIATCDYVPQPYVNTCYNSTTSSGVACGGCNSVVEASSLSYADYDDGAFVLLPTDALCEPAVDWICPGSDDGLCCVQKANFTQEDPYRKLCGKLSSDIPDTLSREEIDLWLQGASIALESSFGYGSSLSVEVSWPTGATWSIDFVDSAGIRVFTLRFVQDTIILENSKDQSSLTDAALHDGRKWLTINVERDGYDVFIGNALIGRLAHAGSPYSIHSISIDASNVELCAYRMVLKHGTQDGKF